MTATTTPSIWVGCLAAYNGGCLHGEWFDLDDFDDADELYKAVKTKVLATSPEPGAEEFHICDHEGFGPFEVDRYESLTDVHRKAEALSSTDADVLSAACSCFGDDYVLKAVLEDGKWVTERHVATHDKAGDYAHERYADEVPEGFRSYVDWESYEDDLCTGNTHRAERGGKFYYFNDC